MVSKLAIWKYMRLLEFILSDFSAITVELTGIKNFLKKICKYRFQGLKPAMILGVNLDSLCFFIPYSPSTSSVDFTLEVMFESIPVFSIPPDTPHGHLEITATASKQFTKCWFLQPLVHWFFKLFLTVETLC